VISEKNQNTIQGKISFQFWIKNSIGFSESKPICRVFFNKLHDMFFSLHSGNFTLLEKDLKNKIFTQKWNLPTEFKKWTRVFIEVNVAYIDGDKMKLVIINSVNGINGEHIEHEYTDESKIGSLDLVFGSSSFLSTQLEQ
jgi:hypothetical protein